MPADFLPYLNPVDWTDETIIKAVKDLERGNTSSVELDWLVTAFER